MNNISMNMKIGSLNVHRCSMLEGKREMIVRMFAVQK